MTLKLVNFQDPGIFFSQNAAAAHIPTMLTWDLVDYGAELET